MRTKITAILIFLFLASAAIPVYYIYRSKFLEKDYVALLTAKNSALKPLAEKLNREESPDSEKLRKLFNEIIAQDSSIAALAVTDKMDRLRFMVKNDTVLNSGRIVDDLVKDIKAKNFKSAGENSPVIKNYAGNDWLTEKLYIFSFTSGGQSTIAVYSFTLNRMTGIRLALESILIISGLFILTALIIILLKKTGILGEPEYNNVRTIVIGEKSVKPESDKKPEKKDKEKQKTASEVIAAANSDDAAVQIDESELFLIPDGEHKTPLGRSITKDPETDAFNSAIFALFKKIHKLLSPAHISLYIKRMDNTLSKTYELKGKNFIKIDSPLFDTLNVDDIEKKVNPVSRMIYSDNSVKIPLYENRKIIGLIDVSLKDDGLHREISLLMPDIKDFAADLNNYLTAKSILIDKESGFLSRVHFSLKLNQLVKEAAGGGAEFSLLLINIFSGIDSDRKQKDTILNIMYPMLQKAAGEMRKLFLHKDFICMILIETSERENENIKSVLSKEISKFRIKITDDNVITLNPQSVICKTAESKDLRNILADAEAIVAGLN